MAVAAVRKEDTGFSWSSVRGKKSCHTAVDRTAGWNIPVGLLVNQTRSCRFGENVRGSPERAILVGEWRLWSLREGRRVGRLLLGCSLLVHFRIIRFSCGCFLVPWRLRLFATEHFLNFPNVTPPLWRSRSQYQLTSPGYWLGVLLSVP